MAPQGSMRQHRIEEKARYAPLLLSLTGAASRDQPSMCDREVKEKSLVRTFTSFLNPEPRSGAQASTCDRERLRKKAWYALLLLSLTGSRGPGPRHRRVIGRD